MVTPSAKLALGTVQLGLPYGVTNKNGQPSLDTAAAILSAASAVGIDTLDTAAVYGDSERVLGEVGVSSFRVVTKVPSLAGSKDPAGDLIRAVEASLTRLRVQRVDAVLLHDARDASGAAAREISQAFAKLKERRLIGAAGLSLYAPSDIDGVSGDFPLDVIQAPLNIFDQRAVQDGRLRYLCEAGTALHVRSAFLQGVLLQAPADRHPYFAPWGESFSAYDNLVAARGGDRLATCLGFALAQRTASRVVVGVETLEQLEEIVAAAEGAPRVSAPDLAQSDVRLIEPRHWEVS